MKKILLTGFIAVVFYMGISSCSNRNGEQKSNITPTEQRTTDTYICPMKCTEKTFDKPGKCPECDMDLEKVNPS